MIKGRVRPNPWTWDGAWWKIDTRHTRFEAVLLLLYGPIEGISDVYCVQRLFRCKLLQWSVAACPSVHFTDAALNREDPITTSTTPLSLSHFLLLFLSPSLYLSLCLLLQARAWSSNPAHSMCMRNVDATPTFTVPLLSRNKTKQNTTQRACVCAHTWNTNLLWPDMSLTRLPSLLLA